jgi:hypothetical protein
MSVSLNAYEGWDASEHSRIHVSLKAYQTQAFRLTENGVPPKWRHTRSVGQSIAGRAPGWSGPSRVNNKQLTTMDIVAEYMEYSKS